MGSRPIFSIVLMRLIFLGLSLSANEPTPILRLEASVTAPDHLYPKQRALLQYRIFYNVDIDLTESTLPFIHPSEFKWIGDVQIHEQQEGTLTIQTLTQEIETKEVGRFVLGPSTIRGKTSFFNPVSQEFEEQTLSAEAPSVELTVLPFPEPIPPSFSGSLGSIVLESKLVSSHPLTFQISISGITNLAEFTLPPLTCQPGVPGFFTLSPLPSPSTLTSAEKVFTIRLTPTSNKITTLPSIEVSSFDPIQEKYVIKKTSPLAFDPTTDPKMSLPFVPSPLSDSPLSFSIAKSRSFVEPIDQRPTHWFLKILLALLALLVLQISYKKTLLKEKYTDSIDALFDEGYATKNLVLIEEAFLQALSLKSKQKFLYPEEIDETGEWKEIRDFLIFLETVQYGHQKEPKPNIKAILHYAHTLWKVLRTNSAPSR